jgi:hypothetical protein
MDRDEILQRVTDALCGELNRVEEAALQAALAADPALAAEARQLSQVWQRLGKIQDEGKPEPDVLIRVLSGILRQNDAELSDEELDMAAGGVVPDDAQWRRDMKRDPENG